MAIAQASFILRLSVTRLLNLEPDKEDTTTSTGVGDMGKKMSPSLSLL